MANFLKQDYQSHKEALIDRVRGRWPGVWNDFFSGSFGVMILEIVAWSYSTLTYTVNRLLGESFVSTMTLRESAVRIGSLTGYRLRGASPAVVKCAVQTAPTAGGVVIRKGTPVGVESLVFEVERDYTIPPNETAPLVEVLTISPLSTGNGKHVESFIRLKTGSYYADVKDSTVDLRAYIEAGQIFSSEGEQYGIASVETEPGFIYPNRIVLDREWNGASTEQGTGIVVDRRIALVQGQTAVETVDFSSAIVSGTVKLTKSSVIEGSVSVQVNGTAWKETQSLHIHGPSDKVYQLRELAGGELVLVFGDGTFGQQVEGRVEVTYRTGGGAVGNISGNTIRASIPGYTNGGTLPVTVQVSNPNSPGSGGVDRESLEEARANIPAHTRTGNRAVTLSDYEAVATQFRHARFGQVRFARAARSSASGFIEPNLVKIYAWTTGSEGKLVPLAAPLKTALQNHIQSCSVATDLVQIIDGTTKPAPITVRVQAEDIANIQETERLVRDSIDKAILGLTPGSPVIHSKLVAELKALPGVRSLQVLTPDRDLRPSNSFELFIPPSDSALVEIPLIATAGKLYLGQLPMFPVTPWSIRMFLSGVELTVIPHTIPGYARIVGAGISDSVPSTINLTTGRLSITFQGAAGTLTVRSTTIQSYTEDAKVSIYAGYTGELHQTKRREIRAALRAWANGLAAGGALYAAEREDVLRSKSNIKDVILQVPGVNSVSRVAIDNPASIAPVKRAASHELFRLDQIILNNEED